MELHSEILLKSVKNLRKETEGTFNNMIEQRQSEIKFLIKQRWLFGRRPDGSLIGHYRSTKYAEEKNRLNPKAGLFNVDLIDTSDLVDAIKIILKGKGVEIISTDTKFKKIVKDYGIDNFNITEEETEDLLKEVSVETIDYLYTKHVL